MEKLNLETDRLRPQGSILWFLYPVLSNSLILLVISQPNSVFMLDFLNSGPDNGPCLFFHIQTLPVLNNKIDSQVRWSGSTSSHCFCVSVSVPAWKGGEK